VKRQHYLITSIVVAAVLLGAGALVIGQSHVPYCRSRVPYIGGLNEGGWDATERQQFKQPPTLSGNYSR